MVSLMTKAKRMIVDNIFLGFQKSGTKSRGVFTFCTAAAILRCTFCPALLSSGGENAGQCEKRPDGIT
jgi:hypothetical protein